VPRLLGLSHEPFATRRDRLGLDIAESKNRTIAQEQCARGATSRMQAGRRRFDRTAMALRLHASCSSPDQPDPLMTIPVRPSLSALASVVRRGVP